MNFSDLKVLYEGCRHSSVDSSMPSKLPPWVWFSSPKHTIYPNIKFIELCNVEKTKKIKEAGIFLNVLYAL